MTDYSNPCEVLPELRKAYYALLSGKGAQTVEHQTGSGTKRLVTYQKTDLIHLRDEVRRLEGLCDTSGKPRRRVLLAR